VAVTLVQQEYRVRTDATAAQGGTPVWAAAQNISAGIAIAPNTTFRIRFAIADTGTTSASSQAYSLFVSKNGGAYAQVPSSAGSNPVYCTDATSGGSANNSAITSSLLTGASGSFSGVGVYNDSGTTSALTIANASYVELEFGLEFQSGQVANADTYAFRVYQPSSTVLNTYSQTPTLTIFLAEEVTKVNAYAAMVNASVWVTKVNAYAVLFSVPADTGTFAWTEPTDTFAFTGSDADTGTLSFTEPTDTFAFTGTDVDAGTFAWTEPTDTFAFTGSDADTGTFAWTEPTDTFAFVGNASVIGTMAWTEPSDTFAFVGTDVDAGTFAWTEPADTFAFYQVGQPPLRQKSYKHRFLGRSFDPQLVVEKDRPGPLRIIEADFWMD
jgi:hypothetical protein